MKKELNERFIKRKSVCIDFYGSLDASIDLLSKYKAMGSNVYINFNGNRLYSLLDSEDSCYQAVTGKTKKQFLKEQKLNKKISQEDLKNNAVKINCYGNFKSVIDVLLQYKDSGINVYTELDGHRLYSLFDTQDSCYKTLTGKTKEEYEEYKKACKELRLQNKKIAKERAKVEENIPVWIEKGKGLIYPQRHKLWEECVMERANSESFGSDINNAVTIMNILQKKGNFEYAKCFIDDKYYGIVMSIVANFSKKGPNFYEFMEPERSKTEENAKWLEEIRKENLEFKMALKRQKKAKSQKPLELGDKQ